MTKTKKEILDENLAGFIDAVREAFRPERRLSVSEWADKYRTLPDDSALRGAKWTTAFTPYLREIMDAFADNSIEEVAVIKSAQVGFTEATVNVILYTIFYGLGSILHVHPKQEAARKFSLKRLMPAIADACFAGKIAPAKSRDSGNTILAKRFMGGDYFAVGANSPDNLASNPVAFGILDEYDRIAASAGKEGSPLELVKKRTTTFWNRKIFIGSTPTTKGESNILKEWNASDRRRYFIPCKSCGELFSPLFPDIFFDVDKTTREPIPETARLKCPHCGALHTNKEKNEAVADARACWKSTAPFNGVAGFHINQILSPFSAAGLSEIVKSYAVAKGDPLKMQVWTNTVLGEPWDEIETATDANALYLKRERIGGDTFDVPSRALVLTIGADTQPDRIEAECVAWGAGEESWSLDYRVFYGDPAIPEGAEGSPWDAFLAWTRKTYRHEWGGNIVARVKFIDSGGANTQDVYRFCAAHRWEYFFAIKGSNQADAPIVGAVQRRKIGERRSRGVKFIVLGTQRIKDVVVGRLNFERGAGTCHFPHDRPPEYFDQLCSEYKKTFYKGGNAVALWTKRSSDTRNEALDCRVYAFAALRLEPVNWQIEGLRRKQAFQTLQTIKATESNQSAETIKSTESPQPPPDTQRPAAPVAKKNSPLSRMLAARKRN